jgi:hypothetical protein
MKKLFILFINAAFVIIYSLTVSAQSTVTTLGGTTNKIPLWTGSTTILNSVIAESSSKIGIGTTTPNYLLHQYIGSASANYHQFANSTSGTASTDGLLIGIDGSANAAITQQEQLPILFSTHNGTSVGERMRLTNVGNLGIGLTAPTRLLHLHIATASTANYTQITNNTTGSASTDGLLLGLDASGNAAITQQEALPIIFSTHNGTSVGERVRLTSAGNLGIGTTAPTYKLQVDLGNILVRGDNNFGSANNEAALYMGDVNHYIKSVNGYGLKIGTYQAADVIKIVQVSGRVIIAGATQSGGSHDVSATKLTVNGAIVAKELYATASNWADYVFKSDYQLRSLNEVEIFIAANKHLPDVPSEAEIVSNGNNLGETDAVLLRKIEELTLYIIEQNKRITELESKKDNGK